MEAVDAGKDAVAELIATCFPRCIDWKNKDGFDAVILYFLDTTSLVSPIST